MATHSSVLAWRIPGSGEPGGLPSIQDTAPLSLGLGNKEKRWQEYTEELYKKDLHDPDNHEGVITDLEPDILECAQPEGSSVCAQQAPARLGNFLEEIPSLSHSVVFFYFFALIAEEGFLISPCYSLELCIQMLISFLFSFAFHFSSFHSYL